MQAEDISECKMHQVARSGRQKKEEQKPQQSVARTASCNKENRQHPIPATCNGKNKSVSKQKKKEKKKSELYFRVKEAIGLGPS